MEAGREVARVVACKEVKKEDWEVGRKTAREVGRGVVREVIRGGNKGTSLEEDRKTGKEAVSKARNHLKK